MDQKVLKHFIRKMDNFATSLQRAFDKIFSISNDGEYNVLMLLWLNSGEMPLVEKFKC